MALTPTGPTGLAPNAAPTYKSDGALTYDDINIAQVTCIPNIKAKLT